MTAFAAFEFLVYVIPGALLLLALMILFPSVRAFFGTERMDVGGLGVFLIISFGFGLVLNGVAGATIQRLMIAKERAYQAQTLMSKNVPAVVLPEVRERFFKVAGIAFPELVSKLNECRATAGSDEQAKEFAAVWAPQGACRDAGGDLIRRVHTRINLDRLSDRLEVYVQHYALSLTVTAALRAILLVLASVFVFQALTQGRLYYGKIAKFPRPVQVVLLIAVAIAIYFSTARIANFDRLFAQELFNTWAFSRTP